VPSDPPSVAGADVRTAAEAISEQIRSRIASGELRPGDMLPSERVLLEAYNVARPTMRGALRILESDGLVSIERGTRGGARIVEPDLAPLARRVGLQLQLRGAQLSELFEAQALLQPPAAALAAIARDDADLARLRACIDRCVAAESVDTFLAAVQDFGNAVLRATHNQVLALFGELTSALLTQTLSDYTAAAGITLDAVRAALNWAADQFVALVDLIEAGQADEAERFWRSKLEAAATGWPGRSPFVVYRPVK
jgi:DNA-binding FadR family transcriptional regulator